MKNKLLSLLLVVTLLAVTVSTGLPSIFAAEENLITNGDFSDHTSSSITGWGFKLNSKSKASGKIEDNVQITDDLKTNVVTFKTGADAGNNFFYHNNKINIEKNATYTMTFWVRVKNIKGFTAYFYEPDYVAKDGTYKTDEWTPADGTNIYTYSHDNGSTRVCRTDIHHSWKAAATGTELGDANGVSMFITRKGGTNQVLTPDFPAANKEGEWMQVIHTFSTGNLEAHEAVATYSFKFPGAVDGEVSFADFKMNVVKSEVEDYYTPALNNDTLGLVSKDVPLMSGKPAEITAEPYGENIFDGWFVDGELVSEEKTLTFTYDPNNPPKYEARFTKADWGIDGSFEIGYTNTKLLAQSPDVSYDGKNDSAGIWNGELFKQSSMDGNNMFFIDSDWAKHGKATITNEQAHSGKFSLKHHTNSRFIGYKIPGLSKNTNYTISFYAMTLGSTQDGNTISSVMVTDSNMSCMVKNSSNAIVQRTVEAGALAKISVADTNFRNTWEKVSIDFNSKDSTEVILWVRSERDGTALYMDDISIARAPVKFKPTVNDFNLGFASPAEGQVCVPGDEVTFKATPLEGNEFDGWYLGNEKVSDEAEFTFKFTNDYAAGLTAHFKAGESAVPNAGFETGYADGQVLAQATHASPSDNPNTDWTDESWLATTKDNIHYFDSNNGGTWRKANISTAYAHTGNFSVAFDGKYGYLGKKLTGLKKNTNYTISFYSLIKGATDATVGSFKVTKTDETVYNADGKSKAASQFIAASDKKYGYYDNWGKGTMEFNSGDNTEVIFWMYHDKLGIVYLDNFAVFEPISASVSADLGGNVSSNLSETSIAKGTKVVVKAEPLEGNTFKGWFDTANNLVSTDAEYSFVANETFSLTAKFEGYNMPARDHLLSVQGYDGTFESYGVNTTLTDWLASDPNYTSEWCKYSVSDFMAYEGQKSLKISARYRNSILALNGLVPYTDYRLSFYVAQPDSHQTAKIDSMGIIGENDSHLGSASTILTQRKVVVANTGWNKIDLYFNSGDNAKLKFILRYSTDMTADNVAVLFVDNMSLTQYKAGDELVNGDFEAGKTNWVGTGTATTDGTANVYGLAANESVYQSLNVDAFSTYNVSFKAKGDVTAAALDIAKTKLNVKNYISSVSYTDASADEWKEYSFDVYSGIHEAFNLVFATDDKSAMIDDVKFTKKLGNAGSILEKIDFETERFELSSITDSNIFSIYTATKENDPNVYAGKKSLKFTYNELLSDTENIFKEAWLSYQPGTNNNFKITMKYKVVGGKTSGFIGLAPEYSGTYGADSGFEHMADNEKWESVTFYVNNTTHAVFKAKIASIMANTAADFYVDDIVISVTPPMVSEENSKMTYCERLYNAIDNEGFESTPSAADWKGLPTTAKVIKGDALKGKHFLRASAGTHYVLEVPVSAGVEYYFAASVRGTATTVGNIGVTVDKEGTTYYANRDEEPASIVEFDSEEKGWKRKGFKFTTDGSGIAYVTIDVTSGALDIDSVMMFTTDYGYRYDPNDYTVYVPYDYDNLKSSTTVINGGFGEQPYYDGDVDGVVDDTGSPSTGDSVAMPVMIIVLAVVASFVLMFIRKRREGADNA